MLHPSHRSDLSRRHLFKVAAGAVAAPAVLRATRAAAAQRLVFVSWGGTYRAAQEAAMVKPFTAETGIEVTIVDTPDLAKVKAQIASGNVEWDVFDAPGTMALTGSKQGFWEAIDPGLFDASDLRQPVGPDRVPFFWSTGGIAFDPKRFPDGKHPVDFAQYFDVKAFPGQRALRNRASETLEAALLADGVPIASLYPLDVDRAFRKLDEIKPAVSNWVESTPQTVTLLQTGEVDFSYTYATRVRTTNATATSPLGFSFKQNLNLMEYLVVLKNAPNRDAAMKFVSFALRPEVQAATMEGLNNYPMSKKALPMLSADCRKWLPDLESGHNVLINDAWWADNYDVLTRRFKEWVLS